MSIWIKKNVKKKYIGQCSIIYRGQKDRNNKKLYSLLTKKHENVTKTIIKWSNNNCVLFCYLLQHSTGRHNII